MLPLAFTLCLLLCGCMSRTENRGVEKIGGADGITGIVVGDSRENDSSLGAFRVCTYEGPLYPDTFCYILTLKSRIYSGDGVFTLSPVDRADESLPSYSGRRYTQRGTPDDVDAVVWQLVANGGGPIFNFLYESGRLVMLNDTCGKIDGALFWRRTDIRKGVRI